MDKVVATFEPSNQPVSLKYIAYGKLDEVGAPYPTALVCVDPLTPLRSFRSSVDEQ